MSGRFGEGSKVGRKLRRRKLIEPMLISRSLKLSLLDDHVQNKPVNVIKQGCHDPHQLDHGGSPERTHGGLTQDGIVLLERTVGSSRRGSQTMQLPVTIRTPGDFENQTWVLSDRHMSGESETIGTMWTVAIPFQQRRIQGLRALFKAS